MKHKLLIALALLGSVVAQAQITTGENSSQVIRTGNRADKGDFGIYLGATSNMMKDLFDGDTKISALPLINLKYMVTDKVEARLGFEWYAKNQFSSSKNNDHEWEGTMVDRENKVMFYPGIAYHFNKSNILDVYVGGELPIGGAGLASYTKYNEDLYKGEKDKHAHNSATQFNIGLGAFIGLQAYICNLPLAIGLEYGVSCQYNHVGNGIFSEEGMTIEEVFPHASDNKFILGNQARLTFSYYFKL